MENSYDKNLEKLSDRKAEQILYDQLLSILV